MRTQISNFYGIHEAVRLSSPVEILKGIGSRRAAALAKLGVFTLEDLLFLLPRRYEDRRFINTLSNLEPGKINNVVVKVSRLFIKSGRIEAAIRDRTGTAKIVWFSVSKKYFIREGMTLAISGTVENKYSVNEFVNPEFQILKSLDAIRIIGRVFPVYPANSEIKQNAVRGIIRSALENYSEKCVKEFLPQDILQRFGMMSNREALLTLHNPKDSMTYIRARNRLSFEELFLLQAGMLLRRQKFSVNEGSGVSRILTPGKSFQAFMNNLPFKLTDSQRLAIDEILGDLARDKPMNRLLQGDVGSGKTLVAFAALLTAGDSGTQAALMAPTEILAWQHYEKLRRSLESLGLKAGFLSGSLKAREKRDVLERISTGEINIVIGTHSIFSEGVNFRNLSLVIIDEQHRFGVLQRGGLISKGSSPHVLAMTATPIPRTLLLSLYGDLDSSTLRELPAGRRAIQTIILSQENFHVLRDMIRERVLARHEQIYWVCPLIDESEESALNSVSQVYERLTKLLPEINIASLHGKMSPETKSQVMQDFADNKVSLLISTVIIEVGVDVPNASMIVIQDAGNFGLAQLHQLRGRVGRGKAESVCVLLEGTNITPEGKERLQAMQGTSDGFELAECDLRQRGSGEICGTRQHGINEFRVADLIRDEKILLLARDEARALINRDKNLESEPLLKNEIMRRLAGGLELAITS